MKFTACVLTFTVCILTVSVSVYQNKFLTGSCTRPLCCSVSAQSLVRSGPWSPLAGPRTWPASHVQGSPAQTGRNTNSKMVRNQKKLLTTQNLKEIHILRSVCRPTPFWPAIAACVWLVLRNALSPLPRCGPYDTRYLSRQTHTK